MKEAKYILTGLGVGILLLLALYFFWHIPEVDKSYKRGLEQCTKEIDTVYLPGKDSVVYRDTTIYIPRPAKIEDKDSSFTITSSDSTMFISGKDTIISKPSVNIAVEKKGGKLITENLQANWTEKIQHKDFEQQPDTIKIKVPEFIPVVEKETNWLISGIAYIAGILTALTTILVAK